MLPYSTKNIPNNHPPSIEEILIKQNRRTHQYDDTIKNKTTLPFCFFFLDGWWLHFPCTVRVVDQKIFGVIVIFRCYYSGWSNDAVYVSVAANVVRCFVIVYSIFRHKWDFFRGLSCALIAQSVWVCICHSPFSIRIIIVRTFDNRTLSGTYALFLPVCT